MTHHVNPGLDATINPIVIDDSYRERKMKQSHLVEIYEKYKHLDGCLSDTVWCNAKGAAIYGIAGEMWRAIKREVEKK